MVAGLTFPFYSEARIFFNPTYKYNNGTDEYDTSCVSPDGTAQSRKLMVTRDKARIPAWCDRILRKGVNLKQAEYSVAPLRFSDHRPVYATFQCTINVIDEAAKARMSREIYKKRSVDVKDARANANVEDSDDDEEEIIGYQSIAPGLPPASSDNKWWLDSGE
jgi:hypothetical protein